MTEMSSATIGQPIPPLAVGAPAFRKSGVGLGFMTRRKKGPKKKLRSGEILYLWFSRLIIWAFMAIVLIPFLWIIAMSFQPGNFFFGGFLPTGFTWANYEKLPGLGYFTYLRNSLVICTTVGVATVSLVTTMAYAFSRFRFVGRQYGLMTLLIIQMFPAQMSFVAYGLLLHQINGFDTIWGYILCMIGGGLPFNAWLFKGYVDSLPVDLEEAGYVDGASKFQAFRRIILPLTRPMMAVIFIFVWFGLYSDFIVASFLLPTNTNWTMTLGIIGLNEGAGGFANDWTLFAAGSTVASLPLVIVFLSMQRFLVSGLSRGAVKG
jgi:arabinogalactan oligomer/maltooligosaccharide transport system permease protein